ncbi:MAG: fimbrillin family protein [Prevotella sp.]|nr:fimbrillin family protein [Prevotella sp.]
MKKSLILFSVAALALVSCAKVQDVYTPEAHEIAFQAITTPATRAAVDGTTFPTSATMEVAAYDATAGANYFGATTFSNVATTTTWSGSKYWPFTPATINFLAYAELTAGSATWNATNPASAVTLVMGDNRTAQKDLMYACGTGTVTQGTGASINTLTFPTDVDMEFKHAQAWVNFTVKAGDAASASAITINSITLNSVSCQGTYAVTHTNWDQTKENRDADATKNGSVAGVWSEYATYATAVPSIKNGGYSALSTSVQDYSSLMVVPAQGMASFTINYTLGGNTYNYTYTPASTSLAQATKYIYNITLTVHEILIDASVHDWTDGGSTPVNI